MNMDRRGPKKRQEALESCQRALAIFQAHHGSWWRKGGSMIKNAGWIVVEYGFTPSWNGYDIANAKNTIEYHDFLEPPKMNRSNAKLIGGKD